MNIRKMTVLSIGVCALIFFILLMKGYSTKKYYDDFQSNRAHSIKVWVKKPGGFSTETEAFSESSPIFKLVNEFVSTAELGYKKEAKAYSSRVIIGFYDEDNVLNFSFELFNDHSKVVPIRLYNGEIIQSNSVGWLFINDENELLKEIIEYTD